jgi:hypothetical protein
MDLFESDNVARLVRPRLVMTTSTEVKGKHHFCSASLKAKALRMSNTFCHALGLPLMYAASGHGVMDMHEECEQ